MAGVDYQAILTEAEKEADVVLWDGGNNDIPFYMADLEIVVVDPHRAGHELQYYPGSVNFRRSWRFSDSPGIYSTGARRHGRLALTGINDPGSLTRIRLRSAADL